MNMIVSDYEGVTVTAIHRQGVIAGLEDFTVLKCDMVAPDKANTRAAAL